MEDGHHFSLSDSEVTRSPGPLDGSPYAQVKKKKRSGKESAQSSLSVNRGYYSADELTVTSESYEKVPTISGENEVLPPSIEISQQFSDDDRRLQGDVREGDVKLLTKTTSHDVRSVDLLRDVTARPMTSTVDASSECGYHTILPTDNESFAIVNTTSSEDGGVDRNGLPLPKNSDNERIQSSLANIVRVDQDKRRKRSDVSSASTSSLSKHSFSSASTAEVQVAKEETSSRCGLENVEAAEKVMNVSPMLSSISSSLSDVYPRPCKPLTKEEVHEAVALLNECLTDQELRSGSLTPEDTRLSFSATGFEHQISQEERHSGDEPYFSPAQPDYSSPNIARLYGEKSPEYALPQRDVILGSIPTRTAVIHTKPVLPSRHSEELLNNALAELVSEASTIENKRHPVEKRSSHNTEKSVDSGHSIQFASPVSTVVVLRKTICNSDVDSGIESSALTVSTASEANSGPAKKSSAPENDTTVTTSPARDSSATQMPNMVEEPSSSVFPSSSGKDARSKETASRDNGSLHEMKGFSADVHPEIKRDEEEDEEEKRVLEEIENTRKKLAWLQEKQNNLKKQKEEKAKRHSFGCNTANLPSKSQDYVPPHLYSATLPRPPGHAAKSSEQNLGSNKVKQPSAKEQEDIDELLRSVQQLDIIVKSEPKHDKNHMTTTALLPVEPGAQVFHIHPSSPGFQIPDPSVAKRANVFTPAYAHPMHQPQHMGPHHYQIQQQKQEEQIRRRKEEERNRIREVEEQKRHEREQWQRNIDLQEKKREEERDKQEKFQQEFERKQRSLQIEKQRPLQQQPSPIRPAAVNPHYKKQASAHPMGFMTLPSPRRHQDKQQHPPPLKSDDLQSQLDELDCYIAQLSHNFETVDAADASSQAKNEINLPRKRSFSVGIERKMDLKVSLPPEDNNISTGMKKITPPRPPSRTRSSFESVSRRLSHGFELAQLMRQNSVERESRNSSKDDDDVFTPPPMPQPSYPPQTRHTRPPQQQVVASTPSYPPAPANTPQKMVNLEERLSPQLFIAMSVSPGGRPVEDIHSYKEDLVPKPSGEKEGNTGAPTTPGFPVSPKTPYVNASSPSSAHSPVGLAKTPLSVLGLKPSPQPEPAIDEKSLETGEGQQHFNGAPKQQISHLNGTTTVVTVQNGNRLSASTKQNKRLEGPSSTPFNTKQNCDGMPENMHVNFQPRSKHVANHSQDSGFADTHHQSSNGWMQHSRVTGDASQVPGSNGMYHHERELKSPWVHSGGSSPQATTPGERSPGNAFAYSEGVSPTASRSLTGSNDSLLSEGSSSNQPHLAYQQQRFNGSHPSLPPKESSIRNSGSSTRSTSTGSGYLGGTSQTSPHSSGSPASSTTGHYPFSQPVNRRESQLSAYDKQGTHQLHVNGSSDEAGSSPTSGRTSSSSISDIERLAYEVSHSSLAGGPTPKFIKDTTAYWYKPDITRDQALALLKHRPPGSFVVRDSRCYPGAFGLALKVYQVPAAVLATAKPGTDMDNELVRHFLIEPSTRGVKLKGCANEPVFGSLSALIYQHSITPLALPCKLVIPSDNQGIPQGLGSGRNSTEISNSASELLRQGAACNVLFLGSAETESLTGPEAIERAMREIINNQSKTAKTSVVHFKVSPQGITLTDNARKIFFRRHYPTATVTYCGMDPSAKEPNNRRWDASKDRGPLHARVFGFVAKKPGSSVDNICHLFAELDLDQPAPAIVNFVSKVLIGSN